MSDRSYSFIVNVLSGGGAGPKAVVPVARILRDAGASVDVTYSTGLDATEDLIDAAVANGQVVVSVGGDGMLSSIAGRVSGQGGTLGVIAAGRGNDFARMLGLPHEPAAVAEVLLHGSAKAVDLLTLSVGGVDPRVVAGSVYIGVDALATVYVDRARWLPRKVQYPYAALRAIANFRPMDVRVVVDGESRSARAAMVIMANSAYYGAGMKVAPTASVTDGLLDVVLIEAGTRRKLLQHLPSIYDGSHVDAPEVTVLRGRSVEISGTPAMPMGGDGELLGSLPASIPARVDVQPGALSLLT